MTFTDFKVLKTEWSPKFLSLIDFKVSFYKNWNSVLRQRACDMPKGLGKVENSQLFVPNVGDASLAVSPVQFVFEVKKKQKYEGRRN